MRFSSTRGTAVPGTIFAPAVEGKIFEFETQQSSKHLFCGTTMHAYTAVLVYTTLLWFRCRHIRHTAASNTTAQVSMRTHKPNSFATDLFAAAVASPEDERVPVNSYRFAPEALDMGVLQARREVLQQGVHAHGSDRETRGKAPNVLQQ